MAKLIVKTGVEPFTIVTDLIVCIDDVTSDTVYIKITKPDFQHILKLSKYEFKRLFKQYKYMQKVKGGGLKDEKVYC